MFNYRVKEVDDTRFFTPFFVAQYQYKLFPFLWFDIKPIGLGSNYCGSKEGSQVYIQHHKRKYKGDGR